MSEQQSSKTSFQIKQELAEKIKQKKREILKNIESMREDLYFSHKELLDSLDLPTSPGINTCGINQNQHTLDIKTGELKAMIALYRQM